MSGFAESACRHAAHHGGTPRYHGVRWAARIGVAVLALTSASDVEPASAEATPQPGGSCERVRYRRPYGRVPVWVVDLADAPAVTPIVGATPADRPAASHGAPPRASSVTNPTRALVFRAGLQVRADGAPNAYCRDDRGLDYAANAGWPRGYWEKRLWRPPGASEPKLQDGSATEPSGGCFVSMTALRRSDLAPDKPGAYVDSRRIPYVVLPADLARHAPYGLALGDLVIAATTPHGGGEPRVVVAVFADVDERDRLGGGSMALAEALGLPAEPKSGGTRAETITYVVFPGTAGVFPAQASALSSAQNRLLEHGGGISRLLACGVPE